MEKQIILFATNNVNKLKEVRQVLQDKPYTVKGLKDLGIDYDIPETGDTLESNASIKSQFLAEKYPDYHIISEDTGLEVDSLEGAPGVHTARYAGPTKDAQLNMDKLLDALSQKENRAAQFRAVISYVYQGKESLHEGIVRGQIAKEKSGDGGFGYDPIFIPEGHEATFAEMGLDLKKTMSHRSRAVASWLESLK